MALQAPYSYGGSFRGSQSIILTLDKILPIPNFVLLFLYPELSYLNMGKILFVNVSLLFPGDDATRAFELECEKAVKFAVSIFRSVSKLGKPNPVSQQQKTQKLQIFHYLSVSKNFCCMLLLANNLARYN